MEGCINTQVFSLILHNMNHIMTNKTFSPSFRHIVVTLKLQCEVFLPNIAALVWFLHAV